MSLRRTIIVTILLLLLVPATLTLLSGCDSTPDAPEYDNPFDPNGPSAGDPFELTASLGDTNIMLIWNNIEGFDIVSYDVKHSHSFFSDFFSTIGSVETPAIAVATFTYENPDPTSSHYFKIQAFDSQGNSTLTSQIVPTAITTPARVVIDDGGTMVNSRNINIRMTVTSGDSLRISQSGHPLSEVVLPADDSGEPVNLAWDLGTVDNNDTTLTINVVVQNSNSLGDTNIVLLDVNFSPTLGLAQGGSKLAHLYPPLKIGNDGVLFMRFADTEENLGNQPWINSSSTYSGFLVQDTANQQAIHAEFLGDFGFSIFRVLNVTADPLTEVSFELDLLSDHISDSSTVTAFCEANATLMRFSESLDFTAVPWVAYSDTSTIELSPESGEKVIYAQFRNDFADSPILTDYVIHLLQPVDVAITAPVENDVIAGGISLRVQGTATSPSEGGVVDKVMFDGGDGFVDVNGTDNWSLMWSVPVYDEETELTIRARAWAGEDSVTTTVLLLITPVPEP